MRFSKPRIQEEDSPSSPESPHNLLLWGKAGEGDLASWIVNGQMSYPASDLSQHVVMVGGSGVGKTETIMRLVYGAAKTYGWQVIYLDAKGDVATAARFSLCMAEAGAKRIRVFPFDAYNGWVGDRTALHNRLLAIQDYTEPYYKGIAIKLLRLALGAEQTLPQNSHALLERLRYDYLVAAYQGTNQAPDLKSMKPTDALGAHLRYDAFFSSLEGQLDGTWSFDTVDACYLLIKGLSLKEEAMSLSRFFVEDFSHYVAERKPTDRKVLFVIDEFSAISMGTDASNLFERIRSYGAGVIVSSQSYEGLGKEAKRMLGATTGIILHRNGDPEELLGYAGTKQIIERSTQVGKEGATGNGSLRVQDAFRVKPNEVRQLGKGEVFFIAHGKAQKVFVERVPIVPDQVQRIESYLRAKGTAKTPLITTKPPVRPIEF